VAAVYRYCVNHNGARRCRADIDTESKRDGELRLPCISIRGITGTTPCVALAMPDEEERGGRAASMLNLALDGRCHECGEGVDGEIELGKVTTASPCGHTLRDRRHR